MTGLCFGKFKEMRNLSYGRGTALWAYGWIPSAVRTGTTMSILATFQPETLITAVAPGRSAESSATVRLSRRVYSPLARITRH
jgi:hypothetical protein